MLNCSRRVVIQPDPTLHSRVRSQGTNKYTKEVPITQTTVNNQNVSPVPIAMETLMKNLVTMKTNTEFKRQALLTAIPLISGAKISPIINHGTGPKPILNIIIKMHRDVRGNHVIEVPWFSRR